MKRSNSIIILESPFVHLKHADFLLFRHYIFVCFIILLILIYEASGQIQIGCGKIGPSDLSFGSYNVKENKT